MIKYYAMMNDKEVLFNFINAIFNETSTSSGLSNQGRHNLDVGLTSDILFECRKHMTNEEIAKKFGCSVPHVVRLVRKYNLPKKKIKGSKGSE